VQTAKKKLIAQRKTSASAGEPEPEVESIPELETTSDESAGLATTGGEAPSEAATPLHYCLDPGHSNSYKDESRFFGYEGPDNCPTCPHCNKQVASVPVSTLGEYPKIALQLA
jgi:hypothetical protein